MAQVGRGLAFSATGRPRAAWAGVRPSDAVLWPWACASCQILAYSRPIFCIFELRTGWWGDQKSSTG